MGVHRWDFCQWSVKWSLHKPRPAILTQCEFSPGGILIQCLQEGKQINLDKIKEWLEIEKDLAGFKRLCVYLHIFRELFLFLFFSLSSFLLTRLHVSGSACGHCAFEETLHLWSDFLSFQGAEITGLYHQAQYSVALEMAVYRSSGLCIPEKHFALWATSPVCLHS